MFPPMHPMQPMKLDYGYGDSNGNFDTMNDYTRAGKINVMDVIDPTDLTRAPSDTNETVIMTAQNSTTNSMTTDSNMIMNTTLAINFLW